MCENRLSPLVCISFTMQTFLLRWFVEHKMATVQSHLKDYHRSTLSIYYDTMMGGGALADGQGCTITLLLCDLLLITIKSLLIASLLFLASAPLMSASFYLRLHTI